MGLTGRFQFRKTLWGRTVLQIEEEVKPLWSRSDPDALKRRWRDATLMDLADPHLRPLIDLRYKPRFLFQSSFTPEVAGSHPEQADTSGAPQAAAAVSKAEARRTAH